MNLNKITSELANSLKSKKVIFAIILFGSYATGKQKPLSDVDICIITKKDISLKEKVEIAGYASKKIDISFFWDMPPAIRYNVIKEGKILYNKNEAILHQATVQTMSEYLDFKHIIDRRIAKVFG